jgi:hypothetical protein
MHRIGATVNPKEDTVLNAHSIASTTPLSFGLHPTRRDAVQTPQKRKARILVVDDDPGLLRLLTIRLRAENYEVEAVESAACSRSCRAAGRGSGSSS